MLTAIGWKTGRDGTPRPKRAPMQPVNANSVYATRNMASNRAVSDRAAFVIALPVWSSTADVWCIWLGLYALTDLCTKRHSDSHVANATVATPMPLPPRSGVISVRYRCVRPSVGPRVNQ